MRNWSGCNEASDGRKTKPVILSDVAEDENRRRCCRREWKERNMANTKNVEDKQKRKEIKREARKKAAPKAPRTGARGSNKATVKKAARGQAKRK